MVTPDFKGWKVRPAAGVSTQIMGNGVLLVNLQSGRCWELGHVGGEIWRRLCAGESLEDIAGALQQGYGIDGATAKQDIDELVGELARHALVERTPGR